MKVIPSIFLVILSVYTAKAYSQDPESFQDAKILAAKEGKPVLMEFLRPG